MSSVTRDELARNISSQFHLRAYVSRDILALICDDIGKALRDGKSVHLRKLGIFHAVTRKARRRYDPNTGKIRTTPAHKDVIFRLGKQLLRRVGRSTAKRK